MSKRVIVFGVMMTLLLIITATLAFKISGKVTKATETNVLFEDDFEGYNVGTFPYGAGGNYGLMELEVRIRLSLIMSLHLRQNLYNS